MKLYPASSLEFIARIKGDGSSLEPITLEQQQSLLNNIAVGPFTLTPLSVRNKTFIASAINTYIVKIKPSHYTEELNLTKESLLKQLSEINRKLG